MIPSATAATDRHSEPVRKANWSSGDSILNFADLFAAHTSEEDSPPWPIRPERKRAEYDESDPNCFGYDRQPGLPDCQAPRTPAKAGKGIDKGNLSGSAITPDSNSQSGVAGAVEFSRISVATPDEVANLQLADEDLGEPGPPSEEPGMPADLLTAEGIELEEGPALVPELTVERVSAGEVTPRGEEEESQETEAPTDGTGVAPQDPTMDWAQQQDESAGQEQNLPGAQVLEMRGATARRSGEELTPLAAWDVNHASNEPPGLTTELPPESADVAARVSMIEHIESTIDLATSRLIRSNEHSVSVVLRPEPGTELRVHVRIVGDKIEAAVELQEGNSAVLRSTWPQLQEKLEKQGILLGEFTSSGGFNTHSQDEHKQPPPESSSSLETVILPGRPARATAPVKSTAFTKTHFESWA